MPAGVSSNFVVRFGVFEADLRSGELRKNGIKIKIQELPFQALKLLLSRPNEVLSREDLRQSLWPDGVYVDFDRGVISAINRLRDTLGDSAENPIFIETVGRRGYRWIAPTHISEPLGEAAVNSDAQPLPVAVPAPTRSWKLVFVLPVLALIVLVWTFWQHHGGGNDHSAKATTIPNSAVSSALPAPSSARAPANREAEEFYLKGRYYWEKRSPDSLTKAVDLFTQAIVHDPNYSPAYVGLANCYNLLREYTVMPASEAYPRALAAARKAVELDERSSEAHASLAFVSFHGMWDVATAEREFQRAIALDPNNAVAHHWYATYLICLRRNTEALEEIERAQALDPASKSVLADKGSLLFVAGHHEEAISLLKQMEVNEPDFISPHRYLKSIYLFSADYPHYLVEARKEAVLMHDSSALAIAETTEKGFAAGGGKGLLEALLREQQTLYERGLFSPYDLAQTYAMLRKKPESLQYLTIAYNQHVEGLPQLEATPSLDYLNHEPVYKRIATDLKLPSNQ
jgi:DNA-binding winged helix-turn-helix (wHTH) protein/tetratricopeptide (TPR) repeat protein